MLAVWLFAHLPGQVYQLYATSKAGVGGGTIWAVGGSAFVVEILVVLALWFFPVTIAGRLIGTRSQERPPPSSPDEWLGVGCALIGLWVLTTSLPSFVFQAYALLAANTYEETTALRQALFYQGAEVVIGVWLILGAKGFREIVRWTRNVGVAKAGDDAPPGPRV